MYLLLKINKTKNGLLVITGENGSMMQQHEIMELKNPKVTGDLAITYLKVPNN